MGMRYLVMAMVLASVGCTSGALPLTETMNANGSDHPLPRCVWHFTWTAGGDLDTSDTDQTPGYASCDASHFSLDDGTEAVEVNSDGTGFSGEIRSSDCTAMTSSVVGSDSESWFLDVRGCGVEGFLGANMR